MKQVTSKKKGIIIGVVVSLLLIVTIGFTYAYWLYSNTTANQVVVAGDIYMKYSETSDGLSITNAMPSTGPDETKHFDFTIEGRNKYLKPIWYEIVLSRGEEDSSKTRLKDEFLRFRLVEINGEERKVVLDNASYSDLATGKRIWVNTIDAKTDNVEIKYELYMWIAFETKIGNTEGNDYTMEQWKDVYASIKVSVNGDFEEKKVPLPESAQKVLDGAKVAEANTNVCSKSPIIEDDNDTPSDPSDDTVYFSGDNDCVNFNYVWYSGKLWRITTIYPDGTMKMITQDAITAITWNANNDTYKDSWIYQWLNEDFKDTLYNYQNIIVQNANWNATPDGNSTPVKPPTDDSAMIVQGDIGLLNAYEYYQSYKNTSYSNGYLNIGYTWWLITPYSGSSVRYVSQLGSLYNDSPSSFATGARPSINLKSNIQLNGEGTKSKPYTITIDKATGKEGELINTRLSGEYVKVDNKVYRIVGIENNTTKLTSIDYVRDTGNAVLTKTFGSTKSWVDSVESGEEKGENGEEKYWGAYLNNTWLTSELQNYITVGTYYLGQVYNASYKNSICSASNTTDPTSTCTKTSSTWQGLVGLPRVGEMFSAQLVDKQNGLRSSAIWLITSYSNGLASVRYVNSYGNLDYVSPDSNASGVRPSINLKSEIKIISGDGMTPDSAYKVGL